MKTESLAGQGIWALELQENSCLCPLLLRIDWMDSVIFHFFLRNQNVKIKSKDATSGR